MELLDERLRHFWDEITEGQLGARTPSFWERDLLVPQYVVDEEMKKARYHDMLMDDISEFLSLSGCKTLNDTITRPREREIDLEHLRKRKTEHIHIAVGQAKRTKTQDSRLVGQQDWSCCAKYGRTHEGGCWKTRM